MMGWSNINQLALNLYEEKHNNWPLPKFWINIFQVPLEGQAFQALPQFQSALDAVGGKHYTAITTAVNTQMLYM